MYDNEADNQRIGNQLRVMRIIVGALMMGLLAFLSVAVLIVQQRQPNPGQPILISYLAVGFFAILFVLWWVVPKWIITTLINQIATGNRTPGQATETSKSNLPSAFPDDTSRLLLAYQTKMILAAALLEGAAFFGCIAYLLEGQTSVLAIPAVVLTLMALTFPTQDRVSQWVEEQQRRIDGLRT
jgi:hypothetical protein